VEQAAWSTWPARPEAHLLDDLVVLLERGALELQYYSDSHADLLVDRVSGVTLDITRAARTGDDQVEDPRSSYRACSTWPMPSTRSAQDALDGGARCPEILR
jgi:hypothetical protein